MSDDWWIWGVRAAGCFHFVTLALAHRTPIPRGWDENLARLPGIHRRFAIAQNAAVGGVIAWLGLVCVGFAPLLVGGETMARLWCAAIALWWGGRLALLPWLAIKPELTSPLLRWGFRALRLQCGIYGVAFGWLAIR
ncbi:hypothetical protein [Synoicihabitans lomoniglobus]|uniref:Uncharacterized protein n=1 Tax=Synoicihabitans lomoniglobus TaxID=2909285 RepID=A0AAF0A116_9BACT|nr:hypothetical protein [Opitutaceae bacterium LMO-M01]WED64672.1 hypothetical protein PXH66_20200 [Opitutaceae bacterium LMO-M01]